MTPLVSICCLSYNHENYIDETLKSWLDQKTDFDVEILIHDDASTDKTVEIIKSYAEKYSEGNGSHFVIRPLYEEENQFSKSPIKNISGIYNFPRATGKYIAMCEGDDYWTDENKLSEQVAYMESHPDCSMCFHSAYQINSDVVGKKMMRPYTQTRIVTPEEIITKSSGYPTASLLLRSDLMKALPKFYMEAPIGDIPMQLTMAAGGYGYYIDKPMCAYRYFAPGSWTRDMYTGEGFKAKQQGYEKQLIQMYDDFDDYSDHRFTSSIAEAKKRLHFNVAMNLRDWDVIFDKEYKKYYNEKNLLDRAYLWYQRILQK